MGSAFRNTLSTFRKRAFLRKNLAILKPHGDDGLRKCLTYWDLLMLGLGAMIGAGVFVLTGQEAKNHAGPAVILSYAIAAVVAAVTALCYTEFAVDMPVAGSAFNYISLVFGEFLAWVAAIEMVMEYTLTSGAVAKGFSGYLATCLGLDSDAFLVYKNDWFIVDPVAFGLVISLSLLLAFGMKESSRVNAVVTGVNIGVVIFILCMAYPKVETRNYKPFIPEEFGMTGVFTAASVLFYGFVGFDALATVAEEVKRPARDIPLGMMGSLALVAVFYIGMAAALTGMVPYDKIDEHAPYAVVFGSRGAHWVGVVVSIGAVTGTFTAVLVMLMGQARIHMVLSREKYTPAFLAEVHPRYQTPLNATFLTMITAGVPALLMDINTLSSMVSMGILTTMTLVCAGVLFRTYHKDGMPYAPMVVRLCLLVLFSVLEGLSSAYAWGLVSTCVFLGLWFITAVSFYYCQVVYRSPNFNVPLKPLLPALGMLASIHLIASLGGAAYIRFGVWQTLGLLFYFCYSLQQQSSSPSFENTVPLIYENDYVEGHEESKHTMEDSAMFESRC